MVMEYFFSIDNCNMYSVRLPKSTQSNPFNMYFYVHNMSNRGLKILGQSLEAYYSTDCNTVWNMD